MANGEENRKVDKTDLQIARERLDVQRELAGLKSKSTSDEKFNLSITNKLVNLAQNHLDIEKEREALTRNSKDVANDLLKVEKNRDRILKSIKTTTGKEKTLLQDSLELNQQIINALEKEEKSVKKIEKSFGIAGSSLKVINKLLGGQIPELNKIQEKTRERLAKLEKQNKLLGGTAGKFQALRIQVSEVGKAIGRNILDPIVLIKAGLDYSQQLAELQRRWIS